MALCRDLWRDDDGAEFVEWVVVVSLVVVIGLLIYNQVLTAVLSDTLREAGSKIVQ